MDIFKKRAYLAVNKKPIVCRFYFSVFTSENAMAHKISIDNVISQEIIVYPVIIIKGHIENKEPCEKNQTDSIEISLPIKSLLSPQIYKVVDCKFKILLELKLGENVLNFTYCCQSVSITLNYKPRLGGYSVLPLYIICDGHDGHFQAPENENNDIQSASSRIITCCKLLQSVLGEKLYEEGLGRKSFQLEGECVIFRSNLNHLNAREMTQEELWNELGSEILNSPHGKFENRKFLGFLSCTSYQGERFSDSFQNHDDFVKITQAYVALGGGGFGLFGTPCMFTWPENLEQVFFRFEDDTVIDRRKFMDDSCYRGTLGGCFSTTLGSILHELCHCFDLGHTETGIMGRGFDDIHKVFLNPEDYRKSDLTEVYQSAIEFKEKFDSGLLSEKLQDKRKEYSIKKASGTKDDDTFFTKSCATILAHHRWFNDFSINPNIILKFDSTTKLLTSTSGLRVVEIRRKSDQMVQKFWIFQGRVLKYSFQLPEDSWTEEQENLILVVEDNNGNIIKENLPIE